MTRYLINSFNKLCAAFISQYLYSVRQKRNISSLQTILKQEHKSIRDFTRRFKQAVQQIESYSMDVVLQNFKRSFKSSTLFFQLLSLDPPAMREELYKWAYRYSILEDNIRAATQTVMITSQSLEGNKMSGKRPSKSKEVHNRDRK